MSWQTLVFRAGTLASVGVDILQVAVMPGFAAAVAVHFAVHMLPLWGQALVSGALFALLLGAAWLLTGDRVDRMIRAHLETRVMIWFPLAASLGTLVFALQVFASVSVVLVALGVSQISPPVPPQSWPQLTGLYLWHFLSSVPGLKIPDTLKWPVPFQYADHFTGALVLLFQLLVIAPVIKVFVTWSKIRKELSASARTQSAQPGDAGGESRLDGVEC
jgi:hypothetical protein